MNISIIVIGDEILLGQVTDTNSGMIARVASANGWNITSVTVVPDDFSVLKDTVEKTLGTTDVIITTGGIGPTKDDMTKNVMLDVFGGKMGWNQDVLTHLEKFCADKRIELNNLTRRQAYVPDNCEIINNDYGTAPVMVFSRQGTTLLTLPGVPAETENLMKNKIAGFLMERFTQAEKVEHRNLLLFGITESALAEKLESFENNLPANLHLAYLPKAGYQHLRLDGVGVDARMLSEQMECKFTELKEIVSPHLIWEEDLPLAVITEKVLREYGYTLSSAESCTGGNIAHLLTSVPGSSDVYKGTVVAYHNEIKVNVLNVDKDILDTYGAVSLPVVEQMALGVRKLMDTDCSVATSGIAGPGGGSAKKPVGTVCISVRTPHSIFVDHFFFRGSRSSIIERASNVALIKLIRLVRFGDNQ